MSPGAEGTLPEEYLGALSDFADHCGDVLFGHESGTGPDGDLSAVPRLLAEARDMGLLADPSWEDPASDFGVWGSSLGSIGPQLSSTTLARLAETCAGLAAAVHGHGIGCLTVGGIDRALGIVPSDATVATAFVPQNSTVLDPRTADDSIAVSTRDGTRRLSGISRFVWSAAPPDWLAVVARTAPPEDPDADRGWIVVAVPGDTRGVVVRSSSQRVGLRAMHQCEVHLDEVAFTDDAVIAEGDEAWSLVRRITAFDWLGVAAIGMGTATAALRGAEEYALTRVQGGRTIIEHAAVRMLLAEASHDLATLSAVVDAAVRTSVHDGSGTDVSATDLLTRSIYARLALSRHGFAAVTNCVQVLGGYGYMDDYGMSKRLRDVAALRSRHGSREQLLLALADLSEPDRSVARGGRG